MLLIPLRKETILHCTKYLSIFIKFKKLDSIHSAPSWSTTMYFNCQKLIRCQLGLIHSLVYNLVTVLKLISLWAKFKRKISTRWKLHSLLTHLAVPCIYSCICCRMNNISLSSCCCWHICGCLSNLEGAHPCNIQYISKFLTIMYTIRSSRDPGSIHVIML